jgi:RHS repeat-associated protein
LNAESTGSTKRRFTSYDRSSVTGLDYAVNRHYDAQQGRFTQVDPIGMSSTSLASPQTLNLYAYCTNDPINHIDPSGLGFLSWLKGVFKRIVHAAIHAVITAVFTFIQTLIMTGGNLHAAESERCCDIRRRAYFPSTSSVNEFGTMVGRGRRLFCALNRWISTAQFSWTPPLPVTAGPKARFFFVRRLTIFRLVFAKLTG